MPVAVQLKASFPSALLVVLVSLFVMGRVSLLQPVPTFLGPQKQVPVLVERVLAEHLSRHGGVACTKTFRLLYDKHPWLKSCIGSLCVYCQASRAFDLMTGPQGQRFVCSVSRIGCIDKSNSWPRNNDYPVFPNKRTIRILQIDFRKRLERRICKRRERRLMHRSTRRGCANSRHSTFDFGENGDERHGTVSAQQTSPDFETRYPVHVLGRRR